MPKQLRYRANSVIYFEGDVAEKVFLLQEGGVKLLHVDIESGRDVSEILSKGEFFGVKSALGHYPREEDAIVAKDSIMLAFSVSEFEEIATKNAHLIIKMLKVFSNQTRRTHKQVAFLMNNAESQDQKPEDGLYQLGKFYFKNKKYAYTRHIYAKYLTYYPEGAYVDAVRADLDVVVSFISRYGDGLGVKREIDDDSAVPAGDAPAAGAFGEQQGEDFLGPPASEGARVPDAANRYNEAMHLISQKNYMPACRLLKEIADGNDPEFEPKSSFEIGRCLFRMGEYSECIRYYTQMLVKRPDHAFLGEALFFIGQSHEEMGDDRLAMDIYKKTSLTAIKKKDDALYLKALHGYKRMRGVGNE
ncbi:MAG: cyclic nucleotide-binding domain-containing protein [Treponema sp.]|jgi:CRP-like cAMP-binding protein|nr:cyclic nucleotide-binding domain-containing protein [Treponema sp.]